MPVEHVGRVHDEIVVGWRNGVRYERFVVRSFCSCGWRCWHARTDEDRCWRDLAVHGALRDGVQLGMF